MKHSYIFIITLITLGSLNPYKTITRDFTQEKPALETSEAQPTANYNEKNQDAQQAAIRANLQKSQEQVSFQAAINSAALDMPTHDMVAQLNKQLGGTLTLQDQSNVAKAINSVAFNRPGNLKDLDVLLTGLAKRNNQDLNSTNFFNALQKQGSLTSTLNYFKLQFSHAANAIRPQGATIDMQDVSNQLEIPTSGTTTRTPINDKSSLIHIQDVFGNNSAHIVTNATVDNVIKASIDVNTGAITTINSTASSADIITKLSNLASKKRNYGFKISQAQQSALEKALTKARSYNDDPLGWNLSNKIKYYTEFNNLLKSILKPQGISLNETDLTQIIQNAEATSSNQSQSNQFNMDQHSKAAEKIKIPTDIDHPVIKISEPSKPQPATPTKPTSNEYNAFESAYQKYQSNKTADALKELAVAYSKLSAEEKQHFDSVSNDAILKNILPQFSSIKPSLTETAPQTPAEQTTTQSEPLIEPIASSEIEASPESISLQQERDRLKKQMKSHGKLEKKPLEKRKGLYSVNPDKPLTVKPKSLKPSSLRREIKPFDQKTTTTISTEPSNPTNTPEKNPFEKIAQEKNVQKDSPQTTTPINPDNLFTTEYLKALGISPISATATPADLKTYAVSFIEKFKTLDKEAQEALAKKICGKGYAVLAQQNIKTTLNLPNRIAQTSLIEIKNVNDFLNAISDPRKFNRWDVTDENYSSIIPPVKEMLTTIATELDYKVIPEKIAPLSENKEIASTIDYITSKLKITPIADTHDPADIEAYAKNFQKPFNRLDTTDQIEVALRLLSVKNITDAQAKLKLITDMPDAYNQFPDDTDIQIVNNLLNRMSNSSSSPWSIAPRDNNDVLDPSYKPTIAAVKKIATFLQDFLNKNNPFKSSVEIDSPKF